jgi:hypothetical protein
VVGQDTAVTELLISGPLAHGFAKALQIELTALRRHLALHFQRSIDVFLRRPHEM